MFGLLDRDIVYINKALEKFEEIEKAIIVGSRSIGNYKKGSDVDIAIKMGCNVVCPVISASHVEDWGLEDPTGKSDEEFIKIAKTIEYKVKDLARRIKNNEI